ncbi:MAG: hypothetical protein AAFN70_15655, partial [Planctomycetota bacterium]
GRELVIQIGLDPIFDHDGNLQYAQLRISQEDVFHRELVAKHRELELQHTAAIKEREQDSRDLQSEHTRQITIIAMILIGVLSIMPLLAGFWMTVDGSDDALVEMGRQLGTLAIAGLSSTVTYFCTRSGKTKSPPGATHDSPQP